MDNTLAVIVYRAPQTSGNWLSNIFETAINAIVTPIVNTVATVIREVLLILLPPVVSFISTVIPALYPPLTTLLGFLINIIFSILATLVLAFFRAITSYEHLRATSYDGFFQTIVPWLLGFVSRAALLAIIAFSCLIVFRGMMKNIYRFVL